MDWNEVEGRWNRMKGSVREKFGKVTDDDMQVIAAKKDQFLGKLQQRCALRKPPPSCCGSTPSFWRSPGIGAPIPPAVPFHRRRREEPCLNSSWHVRNPRYRPRGLSWPVIPRASCYWSEKWRSSTAHRCWLRCKARWMPAPPRRVVRRLYVRDAASRWAAKTHGRSPGWRAADAGMLLCRVTAASLAAMSAGSCWICWAWNLAASVARWPAWWLCWLLWRRILWRHVWLGCCWVSPSVPWASGGSRSGWAKPRRMIRMP